MNENKDENLNEEIDQNEINDEPNDINIIDEIDEDIIDEVKINEENKGKAKILKLPLIISILACLITAFPFVYISIVGTKGETGEKGENGKDGEDGKDGIDGINGKDGEDGIDGVDGALFLYGEGVPSDSLGKNNDEYLDTVNGYYYLKKNGKREKTYSAKGNRGDKGDKGEAGSNGDYYTVSSTYLVEIKEVENGTVMTDKASALEGVSLTFTFTPDNNYTIESYTLDGWKSTLTPDVSYVSGSALKVYATMTSSGFVLSAKFKNI